MKKMIVPVVVLAVFGLLFAGCANVLVLDPDQMDAVPLTDQAGSGTPEQWGFSISKSELADIIAGDAALLSVKPKTVGSGGLQICMGGAVFGNWADGFFAREDGGLANGTRITEDGTVYIDLMKVVAFYAGAFDPTAWDDDDPDAANCMITFGGWSTSWEMDNKAKPTLYYFQ